MNEFNAHEIKLVFNSNFIRIEMQVNVVHVHFDFFGQATM